MSDLPTQYAVAAMGRIYSTWDSADDASVACADERATGLHAARVVPYVPATRLAAAEAERDAAVQRADRLAAQLAGAREVTGIVGANADAIVDALRADLARVTAERAEARAQVEAMKPRVIAAPPMQFDDDSEPVAAPAPTPDLARVTTERDAALSRVAELEAAVVAARDHIDGDRNDLAHGVFSDALRGGASALEAHDAALLSRVAELEAALLSIGDALAFSSRDHAVDHRDAWIYGIACGWGDALAEVAAAHKWTPGTVARLHGLHSALSGGTAALDAHVESATKPLRDLLREARERLLDCAAMLHRDVLLRESPKSDRAANQARDLLAKIDAALAAKGGAS